MLTKTNFTLKLIILSCFEMVQRIVSHWYKCWFVYFFNLFGVYRFCPCERYGSLTIHKKGRPLPKFKTPEWFPGKIIIGPFTYACKICIMLLCACTVAHNIWMIQLIMFSFLIKIVFLWTVCTILKIYYFLTLLIEHLKIYCLEAFVPLLYS